MITVKKGKHNKAFQFLQHRDETFVMLIIIPYLLNTPQVGEEDPQNISGQAKSW